MKILYTITKGEIGGAQVHIADLARFMKDSGHVVAIVASPNGWLENEATKMGVRFYPNPYFGNSFNPMKIFRSLKLIRKIVSEFNPDLVHTHSSFAGIITRLAVKNKIPTIFTAHSFAFTGGAPIYRKIVAIISERFVSKYTSKIICVSDYDKNLALKYKIISENKLVTVHNGAAKNLFSQTAKENIIVCNGRLAYPKEYLLLLDSYKLSEVNMKLEIISDGPDRKMIEDKIKELGLGDRVALLGDLSRREVFEKLSKAKVFVLLSRHEGMPLSILEAMSAGLPVVASNIGGIPEEIDSSCGILVSNKKEEVAKALQTMSDDEARKEMGENSKKRFEEKFTLEKFFEETKKVYDLVLAEKASLKS